MAASSHDPSRSVSFGRYDLLFRLAAGGMAEVHAGRVRGEAGFEKLVAIKRMHAHLVDDERFIDMFLDEARLASNVSSPHVVSTLDLGRADDGSLFLVLELVVGQALSALLRAASLRQEYVPLPIAIEILAQAAQGLDDAHEATTPTGDVLGIVHRDVSPHNILVGIDGRARVTDFGIARALHRRTSTTAGELKGKIAYFSPEQAKGLEVDRRSDVFSLGIVAWETLTGRRLFKEEQTLATLRRITDEAVPDPRTVRPEIPGPLAEVVLRAIDRRYETRYGSAAEFAAGLRKVGILFGPTPSPRQIGRWVAEVGGEALADTRRRIDQSLLAARDADDPAGDGRPRGQVPRPPASVPSAGSDARAAGDVVSAVSLGTGVPVASEAEPSPRAPASKSRTLFAAGIGVLGSLVAAGGLYAARERLAPAAASAEAATTPGPVGLDAQPGPEPGASSAPSAVTAPSAESNPTPPTPPSTGGGRVKSGSAPRGGSSAISVAKTAPTGSSGTALAARTSPPLPPDAPPAATVPVPPAPAAKIAAPAGSGPLLGDDAFTREMKKL